MHKCQPEKNDLFQDWKFYISILPQGWGHTNTIMYTFLKIFKITKGAHRHFCGQQRSNGNISQVILQLGLEDSKNHDAIRVFFIRTGFNCFLNKLLRAFKHQRILGRQLHLKKLTTTKSITRRASLLFAVWWK